MKPVDGILFKAQRLSNKEWVYGYYVCSERLDHADYDHFIIELSGFGCIYKVDPTTVCQYSTLNDKNDNKIFKGDIVKIPLFEPEIMAIGFIEGAFCLVNKNSEYVADIHYIHHAGINETEVIGNIFDNPELLENNT